MTRMGMIAGWKRAVLTALTAYALVLQMVLVSLSGAVHAAEAAGPQGILCLQDGRAGSDHSPATSHDGLCCILSCHGTGSAGPAPAALLPDRLPPIVLDVRMPASPPAPHVFSKVLPVGSRAPPRLG